MLNCFSHLECGKRLLFQGTSTSESSDVDYRRIVNLSWVLIYMVATKMRKELVCRTQEQMAEDGRINKKLSGRCMKQGFFEMKGQS